MTKKGGSKLRIKFKFSKSKPCIFSLQKLYLQLWQCRKMSILIMMSFLFCACNSDNSQELQKKITTQSFISKNSLPNPSRVDTKQKSIEKTVEENTENQSSAPIDVSDENNLQIAFDEYREINPEHQYNSYSEVIESGIVGKTLWNVIANKGRSKNYNDLLPLDGGTVGIAHFAAGGLADLYRQMDTQFYFGLSQDKMIEKYSDNCRKINGSGRSKGCYGIPFWFVGMRNFLNSSQSEIIQKKAFLAKHRKVIEKALTKGWRSPKEIMIAISIANSLGFDGFQTLASANHWKVEQVLKKYSNLSDHKERRADLITAFFEDFDYS
jgi:hypothetical protein